ncbi:MAG: S8 family serine peptidase, partial [Acidobacteriota bacterium]
MKRRAFTLALIVAAWSLSTPRVSLAQDPRLEYLNPLSEIYGESHVDLLVPGTIVLRFDQFPAGLLAGTQPINFGIPDLDALVPEFGVTAATPLSGILPGQQLGPVDVSMIFEIEFDETHDPLEVARRFDAADGVAYAEPVFEQLELATPNDPNFLAGNQSSLQLIGCEDAWEFAKGAGVVACSVESFDCEHEDLEDSLHAGGGRCGINGHGTAVAGLIAATTDNALGGAGIGWESLMYSGWLGSCMAEGGRVLNHSVVTTGSRAYQELINEAELRGLVPVISAANWDASRRNPSPPLRNVLVVAATNGTPSGGGPTDGRAVFTAFGELVDIAAPGAGGGRQTTVPQVCTSGQDAGDRCVTDDDCDGDCRLIGGSLKCFGGPNAGDACVDDDDCEANCAVPPYNGFSGTSASGPMASGVVALVAGMHPDWTGREIINHIKGTAEPIYGIPYNRSRYNLLGTGRLDAADAIGDDANPDNDYESMPSLQYVSVAVDDTPDPSKPWLVGDGDGSADAGEVVELVVHLINRYGASNDVEAILTTSAPGLATVRTDLFTSP